MSYSEVVAWNGGKIGAWHEVQKLFDKRKRAGSILGSTTERAVTSNDLLHQMIILWEVLWPHSRVTNEQCEKHDILTQLISSIVFDLAISIIMLSSR